MLADNQNINFPKILAIAALVTASAVIHASIYSLNFMIFPELAPELEISGTAFGVLAGIGLTVAFVLFLIPMGTYMESWDKRTLIIGGLLLKMFFGALQSVAWDFWSLLLVRLGLAAGFATSFVPCLSLIAQMDSGSEFGIGISYTVLATGPYLGLGIASWAGILSYLYGWQTTFGLYGFMCGLEAFVVILLVPQDKGAERMWAAQEGLLTVWLSKTVPALLTAAASLRAFAWFATVAYLPIYFQRFVVADDAAVPAISLYLGVAIAMAGCGGVASGSLTTTLLLDYAHMPAAPAFVAAAGCFLAVPPLLVALFAPVETWLVLLLLSLSLFLGETWIGPTTFMTQVHSTPRARAAQLRASAFEPNTGPPRAQTASPLPARARRVAVA
jgi:predicted MFS family arabinose efflux permease